MIQFLRKKSNQKKIFFGMIVLIVPSFLFWGINLDQGDIPKTAGTVMGKKVSSIEFIRNFEALRRELEIFHGLERTAIETSVDLEVLTWQRVLLLAEAARQKVNVSDSEVISFIRTGGIFSQNGQFDPRFYEMVLSRYFQIDARKFEEDTRGFLTLSALRDLWRKEVTVSDEDVRIKYDRRHSPRDLEYVALTPADVTEEITVSDADLDEVHERLKGQLFLPYQVQVLYLERTPVSDQADELNDDAITQKLADEGTRTPFFGQDDPIPNIGAVPELSGEIFKLKEAGQRTGWLAHEDKEYLFEIHKIQPAGPMPDEYARPLLKLQVEQRKKSGILIDRIKDLKSAADTDGLEAAAEAADLTVLSIDNHNRGEAINKVGASAQIDDVLEKLNTGEISPALRTPSGFAIFKVTRIGESDDSQWEAVREELEEEVRKDKEVEHLTEKMAELGAELKINPKAMQVLFPRKYGATGQAAAELPAQANDHEDHTGHNHS
ncbi:MAG: SurA N-terminal domain-containing protein [Candidatus Omnitrophica bacterium]|nr:SurA N-terminal domain-containing protein [Candidatus Omnitrophota bacterium]